ncbi:threonine/serine exporter family protein [Clostridium sp. E02]|uniref:threonine/serine exporter family protein n=1 Tax=Clostridium sp. E02 TaxID=2487134 RepID=UPI000F5260BD|nr:threonine/serine exporter family protein [Clostridium sp. E02]
MDSGNNQLVEKTPKEQREILNAAMQAGHILLENGAEIFRVEETMDRICRHFDIDSGSSFVLSNGIFTTAGSGREEIFAKVQHIPVGTTHLERVTAVNQLSREMIEKSLTLNEVKDRLDEIQVMPGKSKIQKILASGVGSACFCYLFGGNGTDSMATFFTGLVLYCFVLYISKPYLSKLVGNIGGGALITILCAVFFQLGFGEHLNYMIIGAIMPLVPGVAFTNAIRDIVDGDYIAGSVRMLDALLVFFGIAMGVGLVYSVFQQITGGLLL